MLKSSVKWVLLVTVIASSCLRQPRLPENSRYNTTAMRNDSTWYGTAKALRLYQTAGSPESVRQFNIHILTDIPFPGRDVPENPDYEANGCTEDCRRSQSLNLYNIPLKKGKYKIAKLDKKRTEEIERASYWLIGYAGGAYKKYLLEGGKSGWVRVTGFDKRTDIVEGRFAVNLDEDLTLSHRLINDIPPVARFSEGLFRVKITDVKLK